ncbi:MAG: AbrB/MazE/SpoVT family DNA-binding domain-containing protein [Candidatus Thermoplasmatota archaeon]|jgi:hypothetical protein|nr:AbrB/MazE/SpoVT family DNA-binding domain-containing protein [Candidatus Thermoplasmatota archaeon]MDP7266501.1 AbrB/MazE/SpoVT family DNA-binding domain-containing protein [Candidatus Thermoplasmatota archaeon]
MKKCIVCDGDISEYSEISEDVEINGWKCNECEETFFTSNEMLRWEVLTGRRPKNVRKVRKMGSSLMVTLPNELVKNTGIHSDDLALFKKVKEGILIEIVHPEAA